MTEDELLSNILELARYAGFRVCHFRPARTRDGWRTPVQGDAGFPDLVLAGHGRLIFSELKAERKHPTDEQLAWIHALRAANQECYVWRPSDWRSRAIDEVLACPAGVIRGGSG